MRSSRELLRNFSTVGEMKGTRVVSELLQFVVLFIGDGLYSIIFCQGEEKFPSPVAVGKELLITIHVSKSEASFVRNMRSSNYT